MTKLSFKITVLGTDNLAGGDLGFPGRSSQVLDAIGILKHGLGLFQRLSSSLGEEEEDVEEGGGVENAEDEVAPPLDVGKSHWGEETQSGVESPVSRGGKGDTLASETEREQLWGVGPGDGTPGRSKGSHEEIRAGDETLCGGSGYPHGLGGDVVNTTWNDYSVGGEDTSVGEHPEGHEDGTDEQRRTATPFVDPEQSWHGHEDVDDVLNG